jgi:uncharacterized repeat protein (TIGR03803 family)
MAVIRHQSADGGGLANRDQRFKRLGDSESSRNKADGNLYGTTSGRGAHGRGTVFKITTSGTLTTLYRRARCIRLRPRGS